MILISKFLNKNFCLWRNQHRCKISIIEAQPVIPVARCFVGVARGMAPGNRTPLTTLLLLFICNDDYCLDWFWLACGRHLDVDCDDSSNRLQLFKVFLLIH